MWRMLPCGTGQPGWAAVPLVGLQQDVAAVWDRLRSRILDAGGDLPCYWHPNSQDELPFTWEGYKGNYELHGQLLHFAAGLGAKDATNGLEDVQPVEMVLEMGADVNAKAWYLGPGGKNYVVQAVHIAAAHGHVKTLEKLWKAGANLNARVYLQDAKTGQEFAHATPLHDATFTQRPVPVEWLLAHGADPKIRDLKSFTALHIVAQQGRDPEVVERMVTRLLKAKAELDAEVTNTDPWNAAFFGKTPLEIAVSPNLSAYPNQLLKLLAPASHIFPSIQRIAAVNQRAAEEFTRELKERRCKDADQLINRLIHTLCDGANAPCDDLVDVFEKSPKVGSHILDMLVVAPAVENSQHYPLPRCVDMSADDKLLDLSENGYKVPMCCAYSNDMNSSRRPVWRNYYGKDQEQPLWHARWKASAVSGKNYSVQVQVLLLPNALDVRLFQAITYAPAQGHLDMFGYLAVQALITCAWTCFVLQEVYFDLFLEVVGLASIMWHGLDLHQGPHMLSQYVTALTWVALRSAVLREFLNSLYCVSCLGWLSASRKHQLMLPALKVIFLDSLSTCSLGLLIWNEPTTSYTSLLNVLLSFNIVVRFSKVTWLLRALSGTGEQVLSIIGSFWHGSMREMLLVAALVFMSFAGAFTVLVDTDGDRKVLEGLWRGMLLSDGGGLDTLMGAKSDIQSTYASGLTVVATLAFTLCVVNQIIAVFQEEYQQVRRQSHLLFQRERAKLFVQYALRPMWPRDSKATASEIAWLAVILWLLLCAPAALLPEALQAPPGIRNKAAVLMLAIGQLAFGAGLSKHHWGVPRSGASNAEDPHYVWICHRDDFDADFNAQSDTDVISKKMDLVLQRLDEIEARQNTGTKSCKRSLSEEDIQGMLIRKRSRSRI